MDKLDWLKELVLSEQQMEDTGVVDIAAGFDPDRDLERETILFLKDLKTAFVEASSAFNRLKGSSIGQIKIYGIANTKADFMLFRNGFKFILTMSGPGKVSCRFHHIGSNFVPGSGAHTLNHNQEHILRATWGAFGDLKWTYKDQDIKLDYLVRYYISRFVKESSK